VELVNDLKGYQLIFPLLLHVVGTLFLRVNEGSLWNTSRFPKKLDKTTQQRILSNKRNFKISSQKQVSHLHKEDNKTKQLSSNFCHDQ